MKLRLLARTSSLVRGGEAPRALVAVAGGSGADEHDLVVPGEADLLRDRLERDLGAAGCQPSFPALNFPCVDALVDGFTVTSRKVGVRTR